MLLHVWCIFLGFSRVCSKNVWHVSLLVHATELPIALKLAFLFLLALTRVSQELSQGLVYLIQYLLRVCQQTPKWLVYLCQGSASWSKHALACLGVSFQGLVGCAPKLFGMCFCQFTTELLIASKPAFLSCWRLPRLAKSSLRAGVSFQYLLGWSTNSKMAGVSCQGSASWSNMLLHVWCIFLGFSRVCSKIIGVPLLVVNRVANNFKAGFSILLALSKINQELCKGWCIFQVRTRVCPQTPKWLVYLVRVQQVGPTCSCMLSVSFQGLVGVASKMYWHVPLLVCQQSCQQLQSWLFKGWSILLALTRVSPQSSQKGWCIFLGYLARVVKQTPKWLGVSCLGFSKLVQHALACLVYLSRFQQGGSKMFGVPLLVHN